MTTPIRLAERTTLRVGGPAAQWVVAETEDRIIEAVRRCDASGTSVLVLGGGSNVLVSDDGFPGTVIEVATRGMGVHRNGGHAVLTVEAGESWDDVVAYCVDQGWSGVEALSGIPGSTGATPIQNVGAYGQEVSRVLRSVRVLDRATGDVRLLTAADCAFGYRSSAFKSQPGRWVVLSVSLRLSTDRMATVHYDELADLLGVPVDGTADVRDVRAAVLLLRRRKGMVLDDEDHDTWSAGSFFTNPVVPPETADRIPGECPRYPSPEGVKLSAAWLIEQSGVERGWRTRSGSGARVSAKHTLALVNDGEATTADVIELARDIRARVRDRFGIDLHAEVRTVNCAL